MTVISRFENWFIGALVITILIAVFLIYALGGLNAKPIRFSEPPFFVKEYADQLGHPDFTQIPEYIEYLNDVGELHNEKRITGDFSKETALLHRVIFEGESPELMLHLFAHPDKKIRVRMASAFAYMNVKYSHNDESGYPDKRRQFWIDWEDHLPNLENALFESVITSAQEGTLNHIPYTFSLDADTGPRYSRVTHLGGRTSSRPLDEAIFSLFRG
jgi:hypothetical protein